jgi:hypothetical protein
LPNRSLQKDPRMQCAEPVTGSALIPALGAKKRLTKSYGLVVALAVTMRPGIGSVESKVKSGFIIRTVVVPRFALQK